MSEQGITEEMQRKLQWCERRLRGAADLLKAADHRFDNPFHVGEVVADVDRVCDHIGKATL